MADRYHELWEKYIQETGSGSVIGFSEWLVLHLAQAEALLKEAHEHTGSKSYDAELWHRIEAYLRDNS